MMLESSETLIVLVYFNFTCHNYWYLYLIITIPDPPAAPPLVHWIITLIQLHHLYLRTTSVCTLGEPVVPPGEPVHLALPPPAPPFPDACRTSPLPPPKPPAPEA